MKLLLFKIGALGDLLMTTPLARQLRKNFPDAKIDYLVGESFARILRGNPHIDEVHTFPEEIFFKRRPAGFLGLIRRMRQARYDMIFVLDKHWIFSLSAFLFGVGRRIGFDRLGKEGLLLTDRVPFGEVRHEILYCLDLLGKQVPPDYRDTAMEYFPDAGETAFAEWFWAEHGLAGRKVVCVVPGGGANPGQSMPLKRWPVDHYAALVRLLESRGFGVVLVGGNTDKPLEEGILAEVRAVSAVGATLGQSAAILKKAHAVVCSDGGTMHLAAAVNDRVISIFGPTDPRRLAPLNGYAYLWNPGECGACYDIFGRFPSCGKEHSCMKSIDPLQVLEIVLGIGDCH